MEKSKVYFYISLICFILVCLTLPVPSFQAGCNSNTPDYGNPNMFTVFDGTNNQVLVNSNSNGKVFNITVPNSGANTSSSFLLIHVYGTPYEMGFAQGTLLASTLQTFINGVWSYLENSIEQYLFFLPPWLQKQIADWGLDKALDFTEKISKPFTGPYFYEELQGLADGSGVDYQTLVRIHMLAGLTEGKCSMIGAWGAALDPSNNNTLLQLRSLDWDMDGPFRDNSAITVYHPVTDGSNGHPFMIVGFPGFVGGLTGFSSQKLGISEIGVAYPDETFGRQSRIGVPFIFTLRDILQFDLSVEDSINRLINERRTCNLILGVGDGKSKSFRGFQYSYSTLNVYDDVNQMPYNETWHPRIPNVVYWGMDWLCPSYNYVLSQQILKYYGKLTPEIGIRYLSPVEKSGSNHVAFYDATKELVYVAFASPHNVSGPSHAYDRQYTVLNAAQLFAETI
eukprot:TRINITY_DN3252_c0_g1_i1.p1 TRINITY_DN3252_c0_g1~~TRINITY_DN3252_c0_g1_i1.p1  ORF type:complete len:453 (+),score=217.01 TRINITY_DN3252_c0_g1_i1:97-1455(+)